MVTSQRDFRSFGDDGHERKKKHGSISVPSTRDKIRLIDRILDPEKS